MNPPEDPVFAQPWEAKAFALTVLLNERGILDWGDWAEALGAEVARGGAYYEAWLRAFQAVLARAGIAPEAEVAALARDWQRAAEATPHGTPIRLGNIPGGRTR